MSIVIEIIRPNRLQYLVEYGFVEQDGSLLVASATQTTHWARNLAADPRCEVELRGERRGYVAVPLVDAARDAAVRALILKYGTPAERLVGGRAFRLSPT